MAQILINTVQVLLTFSPTVFKFLQRQGQSAASGRKASLPCKASTRVKDTTQDILMQHIDHMLLSSTLLNCWRFNLHKHYDVPIHHDKTHLDAHGDTLLAVATTELMIINAAFVVYIATFYQMGHQLAMYTNYIVGWVQNVTLACESIEASAIHVSRSIKQFWLLWPYRSVKSVNFSSHYIHKSANAILATQWKRSDHTSVLSCYSLVTNTNYTKIDISVFFCIPRHKVRKVILHTKFSATSDVFALL